MPVPYGLISVARPARVAMPIARIASWRLSDEGCRNSATANKPTNATPNTLSTCTLLHTTMSGIAHSSGRADFAAHARSTNHTQMAIPANENTWGRGIDRGSMVSHTIAVITIAAAIDDRVTIA